MGRRLLRSKDRGGSLAVLLLAERARSEGARPTRANEDRPGHPWRECEESPRDKEIGKIPTRSCARATRGLGRPSLDARSRRSIRPHPCRGNKQAWMNGEPPGVLLARRTRTIKRCSSDARSE